MSVLKDLTPEVIPNQKYHKNRSPILNGYEDMNVWNSRPYEPHVEQQRHFCMLQRKNFDDAVSLSVYFALIHYVFHDRLVGVWSGDSSGHFSGPPLPNRRSETTH
jgi:hypothetical protein